MIITKAAVPFLRQSPNPFHSELPHLQPNFPISPMNPKTQKTREWAFGVLLWHSIPSLKESLRKKLLGFVLRLPHSCLSFPGCFPQTPVYRHGVENVKHKILYNLSLPSPAPAPRPLSPPNSELPRLGPTCPTAVPTGSTRQPEVLLASEPGIETPKGGLQAGAVSSGAV